MRLDLRDLLDTPSETLEAALDGKIEELAELSLVAPVAGVVRATNSRATVVVQGWAQATVRLECSRCLSEVEYTVAADLDASCPLIFFHALMRDTTAEDLDDEAQGLFDATTLDVNELVRQCLLVELPIQPLCKPDCRGLCPACGANRNFDRCGCNEKGDPRWNQLAALLQSAQRNWN